MSSLVNIISIVTIQAALVWLVCLVLIPLTIGTNGWAYIQVVFSTEGDLSASRFSVNHVIGHSVEAYYSIEFTMSGDKPFIGVNIHWTGNKTDVTFSPAKVMVFSSLFSMQNGSSRRISFWDDPYYSQFLPQISEKGSKEYLSSYSINLTHSIEEARIKFANKLGLTMAEQSGLGARILFETSGVDAIREQGQERRLDFSFQNGMANLLSFEMSVTIPDDSDFLGKPTLNSVEMNKILKRVEGVVAITPYGLDIHKAIVEWRVPKAPAFWETPPLSWILSALAGGVIVSIPISFVSSYLWYRLRKPKLSINIVPRDTKEPAIHPRTGIAFYHLVVENNGKTTAYDSEIYVSFKDMKGNELFLLKGKWDRGPEPTGPIQRGGWSRVWPALIPFAEVLNVRPGIPETFCLVVKNNEDPFYAFNAHSYFYNYKNPNWRLTLGKYIVEVEVRSGNVKKLSKFLVENKGSNVQDVTISKLD